MFDVLVVIQLVAIFLILYSLIVMFRGEATYSQKLLIFVMIAELLQNLGYLLEIFARDLESAFLAVKVEYLGSSVVVIFYMMFIRHYCGYKENRLYERLLLVEALVIVILVWTSPGHTIFYSSVKFVETGLFPHLVLEYSVIYIIYTLCAIIIPWCIISYTLVTSYIKEKEEKRKKNLMLVIMGTVFAFVIFAVYMFGLFRGYDPTPVTMAFMLSLMVILVWNRKDYDLTKAASNIVLNALNECVITLDQQFKVLNYNYSASRIFPDIKNYMYVKDIEGFPVQVFDDKEKDNFIINDRYYEGHVSELKDIDKDVRGYTILITDMTETYNQIASINQMREKAEAASKAKTAFLANMSHEIRTPMNAVVGLSELIIEESRGRKMYDYACEIKSAALNLLSIINDILDLSKVEAGKMVLVDDDYYTQILIQDTVNLVKVAAAQKGLQMKLDMSDELPHILHGDEGRIRQILINLLNNAIKFTKHGYVRLAVTGKYLEYGKYELEFLVEDTGIGIREEDFKHIYESFQQLDMNINRKNEGTGLGLAITKSFVQLMEGSIEVSSEYGKGTKFTVRIVQDVISNKTIKDEPVTRESLQTTDRRMFMCEGYKVLAVDDNIVNRKIVVAMMKEYGFDIDESDSGKRAIELAKEKSYDMILMDHMMPEMDGVEATRIIQSQCPLNSSAIIVALTANAIAGAKEMYLSNGFKDFLAKPFERIQLHELLSKWIPESQKTYVTTQVEEDKISEDELAELFMSGVNVRDVIKKRDCSIEDYLELLNLFYLDGCNKKDYMRKLFFDGDYKNYGIEAHALKSAAANIGAMNLSEKAKELEFAVKEDRIEYIFQNYNDLDIAYDSILKEIERVLKKKNYGQFSNQSNQELRQADEKYIIEKIVSILEKVEAFKPKEAAEDINELLTYDMLEDIRVRLNQVATLLSLYEDDKAEEELHSLLNMYA